MKGHVEESEYEFVLYFLAERAFYRTRYDIRQEEMRLIRGQGLYVH